MALFACGGGGSTSPAGDAPGDPNTPDQQPLTADEVKVGIPVQSRMSIALSDFQPLAWGFLGNQIDVTVHLADRFGDPVVDGTVVNFVTEGGTIDDSCSTVSSRCTVKWTGTLRRPGDTSDPSNALYVNDRIGFSTITAYAEGDADFIDSNKNKVFDLGEPFVSYDEPFYEMDNVFVDGERVKDDKEELLVDTDGNGVYSAKNPNIYQGTNCSAEAKAAGHCAQRMTIHTHATVVMSGEAQRVNVYPRVTPANVNGIGSYVAIIQDINRNIPASATSVSITVSDGYELTGDSGSTKQYGVGELGDLSAYGVTDTHGAPFFFSVNDSDTDATNNEDMIIEVEINRVNLAILKVPFLAYDKP